MRYQRTDWYLPHAAPTVGRIAVSVFAYFVIVILLRIVGFDRSIGLPLAVALWAVFEGVLFLRRRRKLAALDRKVYEAQRDIHRLRQEDLHLQVEAARRSGVFDRFRRSAESSSKPNEVDMPQ